MQSLLKLDSRVKYLGQKIRYQYLWLLLSLILAAGLLLRAWGIAFGLPFEYHVDERSYLSPAWLLEKGQVDLLLGPFSFIVFIEHQLLQLLAPLLNSLALPPYFDLSGITSQTIFFLLGRLTSVLLGTATAVPVYLIGSKLWDRKVGLVAALFLAISFIHVRDSHYGVPDVTGTFLVAMAGYYATMVSPNSRLYYYVLAGIFAGLAISTRMVSLLIFVPIVLYHAFPIQINGRAQAGLLGGRDFAAPSKLLWRHVSGIWQWFWANVMTSRLVLTVGVAGLTCIVSMPQMILRPIDFARGFYDQFQLGQLGGFGRHQVDDATGWIFYLKTLRWGIGDLLLVLSIAGVVMLFIRRSKRPIFLFSFPLLYFVLMGRTGHFFARYAMPLVPFLALAAAAFLCFVLSGLRLPRKYTTLLAVGATLIVVAHPLYSSLQHDVLLTREDSRTIAKEWIEEHIPEGSLIAVEWHTPPLATVAEPIPLSARNYQVMVTSVYGLSEHPLEYYEQQGVDYLVSSSFISDIHLVIAEEDQAKRAFYESMDEKAELIAEFRNYPGKDKPPFIFDQIYGPATSLSEFDRPGPVIKIYRLTFLR
jgi:hypothetical protein